MRWQNLPLLLKNSLQAINFPRADRPLMFICLGISFFFWLLVKLSQEYEAPVTATVQYLVPKGKVFSVAPPKQAEIGIKGTGWQLLRTIYVRRSLSIQYKMPGQDEVVINTETLRADVARQLAYAGLKFSYLRFPSVTTRLEAAATKMVPIQLRHDIRLAKEYRLMRAIALTPDSVAITGPVSLLNRTYSWPTRKVVLSELKEPATLNVELAPPPPELQLATRFAQAGLKVEQVTTKELFLNVEVRNGPVGDSLRFFPDRIKVSCVVGVSEYDFIDAGDFRLVVDLENISLDKYNNTAPIFIEEQPEGVEHVQLSKRSVQFLRVEADQK
jgi:hypothetical protein